MIPVIRGPDGRWRSYRNGNVQIVGDGAQPPAGYIAYGSAPNPHAFEAPAMARTMTPRMDAAALADLVRSTL